MDGCIDSTEAELETVLGIVDTLSFHHSCPSVRPMWSMSCVVLQVEVGLLFVHSLSAYIPSVHWTEFFASPLRAASMGPDLGLAQCTKDLSSLVLDGVERK